MNGFVVPRGAARRWLPVVVIAAVILVLSIADPSVTGLPAGGLAGLDSFLHAGGSAVLAGAIGYAFLNDVEVTPGILIFAAGAAIVYGFGIEVLQLSLPHRQFEFTDIAANSLGAGLVGVGWWLVCGDRSKPIDG